MEPPQTINGSPHTQLHAQLDEDMLMDAKALLIFVLLVAVAILGYVFYESQQSGITVKAPGVSIDTK